MLQTYAKNLQRIQTQNPSTKPPKRRLNLKIHPILTELEIGTGSPSSRLGNEHRIPISMTPHNMGNITGSTEGNILNPVVTQTPTNTRGFSFDNKHSLHIKHDYNKHIMNQTHVQFPMNKVKRQTSDEGERERDRYPVRKPVDGIQTNFRRDVKEHLRLQLDKGNLNTNADLKKIKDNYAKFLKNMINYKGGNKLVNIGSPDSTLSNLASNISNNSNIKNKNMEDSQTPIFAPTRPKGEMAPGQNQVNHFHVYKNVKLKGMHQKGNSQNATEMMAMLNQLNKENALQNKLQNIQTAAVSSLSSKGINRQVENFTSPLGNTQSNKQQIILVRDKEMNEKTENKNRRHPSPLVPLEDKESVEIRETGNINIEQNIEQKTIEEKDEQKEPRIPSMEIASDLPSQIDNYLIGNQIGKGAYASVRLAIHRPTYNKVALKIYEKSKLISPQRRKNVRREILILEKLNHPNIVRLYEAFETQNQVILAMEFVPGMSLHGLLKSKVNRRLPEAEAKRILGQVTSAIKYCHSKCITHRDIKLENILLDEKNNIKLIDFGFSTCIPNERKIKIFCGTPSYMAPEIVGKKEYSGPPADIWAMGVLLYAMLCGTFPFRGTNDKELYSRIMKGSFHIFDHLTPLSTSLLFRILTVEPDDRISAVKVIIYIYIYII